MGTLMALGLAIFPLTLAYIGGDIQWKCDQDRTAILPHPFHCGLYYNCSEPTRRTFLRPYEMECQYPLLFSDTTLTCDDYNKVDCRGKYEPQSPCQYFRFRCKGAHCIECPILYPSCEGMQDGRNVFPHREWTPYYILCARNRTVALANCNGYEPIFSPITLQCISVNGVMDIPKELFYQYLNVNYPK